MLLLPLEQVLVNEGLHVPGEEVGVVVYSLLYPVHSGVLESFVYLDFVFDANT